MNNLLIYTGNDFVAHMFLNQFLPKVIEMGINPILITVKPKASNLKSFYEMERYHFYETDLLNNEIYSYLENCEENIFYSYSPKQLVKKYSLQTISTSNVNNPDFIEKIASIDCIGGFSIRCFQIFHKEIIKVMREKGFFYNSHPGILPDYKGVWCLLRGLVNGSKKLGWTLHEIDQGIDTGRIIKEIPIYDFEYKSTLHIFSQTIPFLSDGWLNIINQHTSNIQIESSEQKYDGEYYTYPTRDEMQGWLSSGKLNPLSAKDMVQFYFDLFVAPENRLKSEAIAFKVFLINKISQFETILEMDQAQHFDNKKIAA